jgi:uncharacterized protein
VAAESTFPGVYIEERPGGVRPIGGVSTCATASIGFTLKGPVDQAVRVASLADFERSFADIPLTGAVPQALRQYFQHGGTEAWVVRAASGSPSASLALLLYQPIDGSP